MQQTPNQTFDLQKSRVVGKDIYIQAESFEDAKRWFDKNINTKLVMADLDSLDESIYQDDDIFVKLENISETFICPKGTDILDDKLTKGYDCDLASYIFTVANVDTTDYSIQAPSLEVAVEKVHSNKTLPEEITRPENRAVQIFACSENEKCIIDGISVKIVNEEALTRRLQEEYPDGLTVTLEDESVSNLIEYRDMDEEQEATTFKGMIDAPDSRMAGAYGLLSAEIRLKPDNYDWLCACDQTYWTNELSDLDFDSGVNATSMMLACEKTLKDARVEVGKALFILNHLYIENQPYWDVMNLIKQHNITEDRALIHLLDSQYLAKQPKWRIEMAKEAVKDDIHKYWIEKVAPVFHEEREMWHKMEDQAARENGYDSGAEYRRDIEWTKNPSPELIEKMTAVHNRFLELWTPYMRKVENINQSFDQIKSHSQRQFLDKFDAQAKKVISEARIIPRNGNEWAVRGKINGVQQSGRMVNREDAKRINVGKPSEVLPDIVRKYFKDDVIATMQQSQSHGIKR